MSYLRLFSLLVGIVMLFIMVPASFMAGALSFQSESIVTDYSASVISLLAFGGVLLFNAGYMYIGTYGDLIVKSIWQRTIAAILLAIPILATSITMLFSDHTEFRPVFVPLLLFSALIFSAFVWPAWLNRTYKKPQNDAMR
jgi:hypothetical protein